MFKKSTPQHHWSCTFPGHFHSPICHSSITAQPYHNCDRLSGPWCVLTYLHPSNIFAMCYRQMLAHNEAWDNWNKSSSNSAFRTIDSSSARVSCWVSLAHFKTKDSARYSLHVCLCRTLMLSCNFLWQQNITKGEWKQQTLPWKQQQWCGFQSLYSNLGCINTKHNALNIHRLNNRVY